MNETLLPTKKRLTRSSRSSSPSANEFVWPEEANRLYSSLSGPKVTLSPTIFQSSPIVNYARAKDQLRPGKWIMIGSITLMTSVLTYTTEDSINAPAINTSTVNLAGASALETGGLDQVNHWTYTDIVHPRYGRLQWAEVASSNTLGFAFPYNIGSIGYLTIGQKSGRTRMMLRIENGLYSPKAIIGDSIRIQLDDSPVKTVSIRHAYVYGRHVAYIQAGAQFLSAIQQATNMSVDVQFYAEPVKQLVFQVEGLKWPV